MSFHPLHTCDECGSIKELLFVLSLGEEDSDGDLVRMGTKQRWCFACIKSQLEKTKKVE